MTPSDDPSDASERTGMLRVYNINRADNSRDRVETVRT